MTVDGSPHLMTDTLMGDPGKLSKPSLGGQVKQALRRDILFGTLAAGEVLQQERICERFGVSRMPVRDALQSLMYEGLVEKNAGGQMAVSKLTFTDLEDMFRITAMLHSMATKRATLRIDPEEIAELSRLEVAMAQAETVGENRRMSKLNRQFHHRINQMSHSSKIIAALRAVSVDVSYDFLIEVPTWISHSNAQHAEIMTAMRAGDSEEAQRCMYEHVWQSGVQLSKILQRKRDQSSDGQRHSGPL